MSQDISRLLAEWAYAPEEMNVRLIQGDDGRERVQLRLDLGLLQMEMDGRPDGRQIEGSPSWLDVLEQRQRTHDASHPDGPPFVLTPEDCQHLLREGIQYYHRYLSFWYLEQYALCARDTERNLRLFAFVREYARDERDRLQFDQWRPYVTMMHTRAVATPLVEQGELREAIERIEQGIAGIEQFLGQYEQLQRADTMGELVFLKRWRRELSAQLEPPTAAAAEEAAADPITQLAARLEAAIRDERYEEAVQLRDALSRLTDPPPPSTGLGNAL